MNLALECNSKQYSRANLYIWKERWILWNTFTNLNIGQIIKGCKVLTITKFTFCIIPCKVQYSMIIPDNMESVVSTKY